MAADGEDPRGVAALRANVRHVWLNRNVRRIQLAFAGSEIGEWAYGMALLVWAYQEGGAALVGAWATASSLDSPTASSTVAAPDMYPER